MLERRADAQPHLVNDKTDRQNRFDALLDDIDKNCTCCIAWANGADKTEQTIQTRTLFGAVYLPNGMVMNKQPAA